MEIGYKTLTCSTGDIFAIFLLENNLEVSNEEINKNIKFANEKGLFSAKDGEVYTFTREINDNIQTVLLLGLGSEDKLTLEKIRTATGKVIKKSKKIGINNIFLRAVKTDVIKLEEIIKNMTYAAYLSNYSFDKYKTSNVKEDKLNVSIARCGVKEATDEIKEAMEEGRQLADSINLARDLVNEPPNEIYPETLGNRVLDLAGECGFEAEVFGVDKIKELKMGAFHAVARGSKREPKLIVMRYFGDKDNSEEVLGLVGKGLTFDAGGYSLKTRAGMIGMKTDMAGAASVIGAMSLIAKRKLKVNVVTVVAACENLLSGESYLIDEIVHSMAGKTIEINNTDAEGRLVLIDAVNYIIEKENATSIVDVATLTGTVLSALGEIATGVVSNDDSFFAELKNVSDYTGEKVWQFPAFDEYKKVFKSEVADLKNSFGPYAGSITAGLFIGEFVQGKPWLHLDIAGTASNSTPNDLGTKGGSGVMVHTLYELAKKRSK